MLWRGGLILKLKDGKKEELSIELLIVSSKISDTSPFVISFYLGGESSRCDLKNASTK